MAVNQSILLGIGASIGASFDTSLHKVKTNIKGIDTDLKTLSKQQLSFKALDTAQKNLDSFRDKVAESSEKINILKLRLKNADPETQASKKIQAELDREIAKRDKLSSQLETHKAKVKSESAALGDNLHKRDAINASIEKRIAHQTKLNTLIDKQGELEDKKAQLGSSLMGTVAIGATVAVPIKLAVDFESAMADVKKVVDFDSPVELKTMQSDILKLTRTLPMTAEGIANIMASAGQAGIAKNELMGFAESAAKMGVAFDVTADEAGDMMAKWRTAFKMNQTQVNTLADQINFLGNTTAASAPKISDVVRRIGPLGEVGGLAAGQIAAIGASMVSTGVESEVAATAIKNFMLSTVAGASATKGQKEAYKSLGIDAEKLAKRMQTDAGGAIEDLLTKLQKLPKHMQAATMKELFGSESIGAIAPLLTNLDALKDNLRKVGDETQYSGSMQKEFASRAATTANNFQLMSNKLTEVGVQIGAVLLPAVNATLDLLSPLVTGIANFVSENENLVKGIATVGASLLVLKVGMMAGAYGIVAVKGAVLALNIAMTANPLGLLVKGLMVLGVALSAAWPYLKQSSDAFFEFATKVKFALEDIGATLSSRWESTKTFLSAIPATFSAVGASVTSTLTTAFSWTPLGLIVNNWTAITDFFSSIPTKMQTIGAEIVAGLGRGLANMGSVIADYTIKPISNMIDSAKGMLGIKSPSRVFMSIGSDTMAGMTLGLEKTAPQATGSVTSTIGNMVKTATLSSALIASPVMAAAEQATPAYLQNAQTMLMPAPQAQTVATAQTAPQAQAPVSVTHQHSYTITINGANQNAKELAEQVMSEINRQQAIKQRSGLYDR